MKSGYEVGVVGGGPVGSAVALAFAARGADVLVCEANPAASRRLAGEWMHPPAIEALARIGATDIAASSPAQRGFVVIPEDGSPPITLPYVVGHGAAAEHAAIVRSLRRRAASPPNVDYVEHARVTAIAD